MFHSSNDNNDGTVCHAFFDDRKGTATSTWTYLVEDTHTKEALVIDTVLDYDLVTGRIYTESADEILAKADSLGLKIKFILESHAHADHLTASKYFKHKLGPNIPICIGSGIALVQQTVKSKYSLTDSVKADGSQFGKTKCMYSNS